jgi:hypothetical protein
MSGKGHPLPGSDEARHDRIPEHLERDKGRGDDAEARIQPAAEAEPYNADSEADDLARNQAAHQDRGRSDAESESGEG